jgi:hypothetical protein
MNAVIDQFSDKMAKALSFLAPPLSFGLFAGAEMIFIYGLYRTFADTGAMHFTH